MTVETILDSVQSGVDCVWQIRLIFNNPCSLVAYFRQPALFDYDMAGYSLCQGRYVGLIVSNQSTTS
jgi:hypothetical protein